MGEGALQRRCPTGARPLYNIFCTLKINLFTYFDNQLVLARPDDGVVVIVGVHNNVVSVATVSSEPSEPHSQLSQALAGVGDGSAALDATWISSSDK